MICLVDAIGALDAVSISSVTAEDSPVPAFTERLEEGAITYGGIYRAPDHELISAAGCPLAIENTYIDHVPEARAKLEELGVTVLMEQSSREEDMLGRLEWIRLMGALFGRDEETDEVFEDVAARVEEASSEGPLGTTVAFLYVNEDGAAVTRRAGDYFCQMIEALLLGGALSLSGFLLQTFFANPIADPFVLGVSSGAKLVVAVVMIVVLGAGQVMSPAASVAGIMVGYICSAVTSFLVAFADDQSIVSLDNWSRGSFSGATWSDVAMIAVAVGAMGAAVFALSKPLGAYQLGEPYAQSVGVSVLRLRMLIVLVSSLLSACAAAFAGPVSFVGIAAPHLARRGVGSSRPLYVTPACLLVGAAFCCGCDLVARTLFSPVELSVSAVTAAFGSVELARPKGDPEVFVIAGGGSGAACFRRLARDGVPFATGVLHEHDADGLLARSLASRAVCERDFEPVSERAVAETREVLLGCRRVICCVSAFGTTNARNAELLDAAREAGIPVTSAPVPPHRVSRDCIQAM